VTSVSHLERQLIELEERHKVRVSPEQKLSLSKLDELLNKWNRAVSLVGFKTEEERIARYFIEALHASTWLPKEGQVVDVGSGGGTPALPLAIQTPKLHWDLLEPKQRKVVFLREAAEIVAPGNVMVMKCRFEDYKPRRPVSAVTVRGVAARSELVETVRSWLGPGGRVLFFTGREKATEIEQTHAPRWRICDNIRLAPLYETELLVLERR
jgi:16S rRNA (guanine527-N7)-methyltransferase